MTPIMKLQADRGQWVAKASDILDAAEAEDRDLTDDEQSQYDDAIAQVGAIDKRIERQAQADAIKRGQPAQRVETNEMVEDDPKLGWKTFGEFARGVHRHYTGGGTDQRLQIGAALSTYGSEGVGADGGYLVPPEFSTTVYQHSLEQDALLPLTDEGPISGNTMSFPADEETPWGTTGITAYWEGEAAAITQTKPVLKLRTLRLRKLTALVPVTDELMEDTLALEAYLSGKTGESIRYKTNDGLINGTGAGQPLGVANASALVAQAKETGQTADTIVAENVVKMYARNTNPARAVWLINPDAYPQLPLMTIGDQPIFVPPNGFAGAPLGTLMGRPIIMSDTCQTVGDQGDIYFIDFMGMKSITKAGGIQTATSMHLWFDQNVTAFRAVFRVDAQPWLNSAVTPPNSAVTRSPFVALAARA